MNFRLFAPVLAFAFSSLPLCADGPLQPPVVYLQPVQNVFLMPAAFPAHRQFVAEFKRAMAASDYAAMEKIAEGAVEIFPRDAVWRYNLACAKARRGHLDEARDAILAAANLGFSDAAGASSDPDLAILRRDPAFARALAVFRNNRDNPESAHGAVSPLPVEDAARITVSNTFWNMEIGGFSALFQPRARSTLYAPVSTSIPGKTGEAINRWLAEGTASGNAGDIYDNHDRGHSRLDVSLFSGLVPSRYSKEAHDAGADTGYSLFTFPGRIVFGNSSTANVSGENWSSSARRAQNDAPFTLFSQYLSNCMYVYPQNRDCLKSFHGDVFPSRTPYVFIAPGASWSDRPILASIATALAAMRPEVKDILAERGQIAPAVRFLLHMAQTNVAVRADYLSPRAHPVAFPGGAVDTLRLAELAHSLETNSLPPLAPLRVLSDDSAKFAPERDFPDSRGERLFDSPFAIARVWRATPQTRKITLAVMPAAEGVRYHWLLGQGDADKVKIRELDDGRIAEITIAYHNPGFNTPFGMPSSRVDVLCIADDGRNFSPPSFVTWYFPPVERRRYDGDGRILEIDYSAGDGAYADPSVASKFDFRDIFEYDAEGRQSRRRVPVPAQ